MAATYKTTKKRSIKKSTKIGQMSVVQLLILAVNLALLGVTAWALHTYNDAQSTPAIASEVAQNRAGFLLEYSPEKLVSTKKNVLFFNARWCPHCKATIKSFSNNLDKIPSTLQIFDIDPDASANRDLVKKYQVVLYPTFVQVDENGTVLSRWTGETTPDTIATNLK
jgi:thiol-disulfide isomerase/thioredoxin